MTSTMPRTDIVTEGARERADRIAPVIREYAAYGDEHGRLAPPVVAALRNEGLFDLWVPRTLGGDEASPTDALDAIAVVAYNDATAGWVLMTAAIATGVAGAFLDDAGAAAIIGTGRRAVLAGQGTRPGTATAVDGGFHLTGSWGFGSGLRHATHVHSLAVVAETGEPRIFIVPIDKVVLDEESWDVAGLRGTGSLDYTIDAIVPEHHTHSVITTQSPRGGPVYGLGLIGLVQVGHLGWALGVGRRLLDELEGLARARWGRTGANAQSDALLQEIADLEGAYRAARALAYDTWTRIESKLTDGVLSTRDHSEIRLAHGYATRTLTRIAQRVFLLSGTTGLRRGDIERFMRDAFAGAQHVTAGPAVWTEIGRELSGLAPDAHWQFLSLAS